MLRHVLSFFVVVALGFPLATRAVEFTDKQKEMHPCLKKVQLPAVVNPAKADDVPAKFRAWIGTTGVLVGEWKGTKIGDFCQVVLIEKVDENGFSQIWYSAAPRGLYDGFKRYLASFKESNGQQVLEFQVPRTDISISYSLKSGEKKADSLYLPSSAKGYVELLE